MQLRQGKQKTNSPSEDRKDEDNNKKIKDIKQQDGMSLIIWRFSCVVSTCLERTGLVNSLVPYLQNVTHFLF